MASAYAGSRRATVMIADDDDEVRDAIVDILQLAGHQVVEATDGTEALELTLRRRPDVILVDHRMPGMMGADVIRELRSAGFEACIVLMSAARDVHSVARAVGVRHVLAKPFDGDDLVDLVDELVEGVPSDPVER